MTAVRTHGPNNHILQDSAEPSITSPATSSSKISGRPHSASISSVHFAETSLQHRQSTSSVTRASQNGDPYNLSLPSTVAPISPKDRTVPKFASSAPIPRQNDPSPSSSRTSSPHRQSSARDRPTSRNRPHPLITHGKRPSVTTGGYETSSDEGSTSSINHLSRTRMPTSQSFSASRRPSGIDTRSKSDQGRKRAQSLMSPSLENGGSSQLTGIERGGSQQTKKRASKRLEEIMAVPRNEGKNHPRSASLRSPSHTAPPSSSMRNVSYNGNPPRQSLPRDEIFPAESSSGPSISSTSYMRGNAGLDQLGKVKNTDSRTRNRVDSPEGSRKGKEKESGVRISSLAASLGLDQPGNQAALSPDQIHNLFGDSDIGSALRILNGSHLPPRVLMDRFSPSPSSSTRPISPDPPHVEPFIPTAPPPLLADNRPVPRDRAISVASTIASPPRPSWSPRKRDVSQADSVQGEAVALADRRRRASSRGMGGEGEGGHVAFTHHVPAVTVEEDRQSDGADAEQGHESLTARPGANSNLDQPPETASTLADSANGHAKLGKRHRLSSLFHIKRKKSSDALAPTPTQHHLKPEPKSESQKASEKQKSEKELEMKRREQERHDEEVAQERRFRALTQVAAHPQAERSAYRVSSHLRAYYTHIYDGLEDPPRMNPLAVLRWRHRTEEQAEAKRVWEEESKKPSSNGWHGAVHSSPGSVASSSKVGSRPSEESRRLLNPVKEDKEPSGEVAKGWKYTIGDITAYNDAQGVVNYFIPPRPAFQPDPEDRLNVNSSVPEAREAGSSVATSERKDEHVAKDRITSASTVSLVGDRASVTSREASIVSLSRTASLEKGGKTRHREHSLSHRTHQSLGAIGPASLTQALKMPLHKLGSVARKRHTPYEAHEDSPDESPHRSEQSTTLPSHHHFPSPLHRIRQTSAPNPAAVVPAAPPQQTHRFFRRDPDLTDEERRYNDGESHHLRKLFLKGQRALPFDDWRHNAKRLESLKPSITVAAKELDRQAEVQALETQLSREAAFRERQAEADRRTQGEIEARDRLEQLEKEIYTERSGQVVAARKRLEKANADASQIDDGVRQYLEQVQRLKNMSKVSAQVETTWPGIDALRREFGQHQVKKSTINDNRDEALDILGPLRQYDSPSGSDTRRPSRQLSLPKDRPRGTRPPSLSLRPLNPPTSDPWPRRTMLDPNGTSRVDPITLIDLTLSQARTAYNAMSNARKSTLLQLRGMVEHIDNMIEQKNKVLEYIKAANNRQDELSKEKLNLEQEIRGDLAELLGRYQDSLSNGAVKQIVSPAFIGTFKLLQLFGLGSQKGVQGKRFSERVRELPWRYYMSWFVFLAAVLLWFLRA